MLVPYQPVTLLTAVYPSDGAFLERLPRVLRWYTTPSSVAKHFVILNDTCQPFVRRVEANFGDLPWPVEFFAEPYNRYDTPAYNDVQSLIKTPQFIVVSPDTRLIQQNWVEAFFTGLHYETGLVGPQGPGWNITPQNYAQSDWGWIGRLLVERNIPFDHCLHVQTWCFLAVSEVFRAIGGFWEAPAGTPVGKGDLIAAEISLSVKARAAGFGLSHLVPRMFHYGTRGADQMTEAHLEALDRERGFGSLG